MQKVVDIFNDKLRILERPEQSEICEHRKRQPKLLSSFVRAAFDQQRGGKINHAAEDKDK